MGVHRQGKPLKFWLHNSCTNAPEQGLAALPLTEQAQTELGSPGPGNDPYQYFRPSYTPTTPQNVTDFQKFVTAIGRAIGNISVHETGWQITNADIGNPVPYMECTTQDTCGGDIYIYQLATAHTWFYTGQPKMSWGTAGTCVIENYLLPKSCSH